MVAMARAGLGLELGNIVAGDQPPAMEPHPFAQTAPQKGGGFFREGGMGRYLAGAIGDVLLQQAGMAPVFSPAQQQKRAMDQSEAIWSRRRAAEREDKQWEWQNKPREGDGFERALEASGVTRGSPEWGKAMGRKVENILNPMMAVQTVDANGNPAITWAPRNPVAPMGGDVPSISDEAGYNALPPGAQFRDPSGQLRTKAGGPASPAPGNFPGY